MQIKRDYRQPFFRPPKRHPRRNRLIAGLLVIGLCLVIFGQRSAIEGGIDRLLRQPTPTPLPSTLATRAIALIQNGELEDAEPLLAQAAAEAPQNIAYLYEYGVLLIELGRTGEALDLGAQITSLNPRDVRGFALKARALVWQGQAAGAIPVALAGLELNPRFSALHATLTRAYVDAERWGEALAAGERGLAIEPDDADLTRAYAYALQSVAEFDDAILYLQQSIELRPSHLPPYFELAGLYLARDDDQQAIDLYDRILAMQPRNARAMLRLCHAYRKVGEFERALGFCEDAVASDGSDPEALFQLGMLYYRARRFSESLQQFERCVHYDRGAYDLACLYRLGLSHYYTGDCAGGWLLLQDSLVMAQARTGVGDTLSNIRLGLDAIATDPQCLPAAIPTPFEH